jgi:hypothetical protein
VAFASVKAETISNSDAHFRSFAYPNLRDDDDRIVDGAGQRRQR